MRQKSNIQNPDIRVEGGEPSSGSMTKNYTMVSWFHQIFPRISLNCSQNVIKFFTKLSSRFLQVFPKTSSIFFQNFTKFFSHDFIKLFSKSYQIFPRISLNCSQNFISFSPSFSLNCYQNFTKFSPKTLPIFFSKIFPNFSQDFPIFFQNFTDTLPKISFIPKTVLPDFFSLKTSVLTQQCAEKSPVLHSNPPKMRHQNSRRLKCAAPPPLYTEYTKKNASENSKKLY